MIVFGCGSRCVDVYSVVVFVFFFDIQVRCDDGFDVGKYVIEFILSSSNVLEVFEGVGVIDIIVVFGFLNGNFFVGSY